jgi:hypothetical protein
MVVIDLWQLENSAEQLEQYKKASAEYQVRGADGEGVKSVQQGQPLVESPLHMWWFHCNQEDSLTPFRLAFCITRRDSSGSETFGASCMTSSRFSRATYASYAGAVSYHERSANIGPIIKIPWKLRA